MPPEDVVASTGWLIWPGTSEAMADRIVGFCTSELATHGIAPPLCAVWVSVELCRASPANVAAPEETALSMNWACAWEDSAMSLKHTSAN